MEQQAKEGERKDRERAQIQKVKEKGGEADGEDNDKTQDKRTDEYDTGRKVRIEQEQKRQRMDEHDKQKEARTG